MIKEILYSLCDTSGISENEVLELVKSELSKHGKVSVDKNGNIFLYLVNKKENKETLMIDAHFDRVGFLVTDLLENGFIKISPCGGIDSRIMPGLSVIVHGGKRVLGIVCSTAPHLMRDDKKDLVPKVTDLYVDTGICDGKINDVISLGDVVTFDSEPSVLMNDRITAYGIDNRASVAALIRFAEIINESKDDVKTNIVVVLSTQEETTGKGAITSAYEIKANKAIVVDTSFSKQPEIPSEKTGEMGKGPMIGISPILDRKMFEDFKLCARKHKIPYQVEVMGGRTGTNADHISISGVGIQTALLSIPIKYMHTPNEVVDVQDIESTAQLIKMYVLQK